MTLARAMHNGIDSMGVEATRSIGLIRGGSILLMIQFIGI